MGIRFDKVATRSAATRKGIVTSAAVSVIRREALYASRVGLAILGCCSLLAIEAAADLVVFEDAYVLETVDQSMWSTGTQESWNYDSGLLGKAWGTYSGEGAAPDTLRFDLMIGSDGDFIDDRTGVDATLYSSGQIGINVTAEANGGSVDVTLPVTTALTIDSANGMMVVSGSNDFGAGAKITAEVPSFKAGVNGVINIENRIAGLGCLTVGGCAGFNVNLPGVDLGQFPLVGFDTTSTKPISILGYELPIKFGEEYEIRVGEPACQGPVTADGSPPVCPKSPVQIARPTLAVWEATNLQDFDGNTVVGNVLSASNIDQAGNNQQLLSVTADLTGIAQSALGLAVDVLSPKASLKVLGKTVGSISGTLFNLQLGLALGETQELTFAPTLQATLEFDKRVNQYEYQSVYVGQSCHPLFYWVCVDLYEDQLVQVGFGNLVTVNLDGNQTVLRFDGESPNLLRRTYSIKESANFSSSVDLTLDPIMPIKAGCFEIKALGGLVDTGQKCLFDETFGTTGLFDYNIFSNNFSLAGFNVAEFGSPLPGETGPGSTPGGSVSVPEPSTLWLFAIGIAGLAFSRKRTIGRRPG